MTVRELTGPGRILGNHVVIESGDDRFVVLAHLRRRSMVVAAGDSVEAGQPIAAVGNSGISTEPHLHLQAMDHRSVLFAAGVPIRIDGGLPPNGDHLFGAAA